ncbi:MAG: hypothetical protein QOE00_1298 [Ilumatobacteraceae bacterium]
MRSRLLGAALLFVVASVSSSAAQVLAGQAGPTSNGHRANTDPQLRQQVAALLTGRVEGRRDPLVPVEVLTTDGASVADTVNRLGGTVTGSVEGQLVQAYMPAGAIDALAASDAARYVQQPLRVNRLPPTEAVGFGPTVGDEVTLTNAAAWHTAGITGQVKVGIIDFFDLTAWNANEHGPAPDAAHQFCPDRTEGLCTATGQINSAAGDRHGVAVAEVVKDMAPGAELFLATTANTAETQAAIDWFVLNGVHLLTRSLGAPYDGPGDGTGPLDSVVDYAASRAITWFNSGGNDAASGYGRYTEGVDAAGYVDFERGPGVDTVLRIDPSPAGVAFDGVRWANDWYLPASAVTDYSVEIWQGTSKTSRTRVATLDAPQTGGAPPLEAVDDNFAVPAGQSLFIRIHANAHYSPSAPDTIEVATFYGAIEAGRQSAAFSAAKPVVDSANPALVAVGAVDPANGSGGIAYYSSQGPTNDGRIKPDVSAPSCVGSTIYTFCFNGTSAASPVAAGMAALLLGQGLAVPGMPLAALTRHLVRDLGPPGPDNAYGTGEILLPAVPAPVNSTPSTFNALATPVRLLDTRPTSSVGPSNLRGPYPQFSMLDLPISSSGVIPSNATAVAVNITSTDSIALFYVQALPTLVGALGDFSTINVPAPGHIQPNFAIVPLGQGSISVFIPGGGNVVVDAMGYFLPSGSTAAGRFVPLNPHRVLDTRPATAGPVPAGWTPHQPAAGESVRIDVPADAGVPATGVSALVVNVTATEPVGAGFMQALPSGASPGQTSNVNYAAGETTATHAVVPLGAGGTISVFTSNAAHIVVDVMGYITDTTAAAGTTGRFVPVTPGRYYDSRSAPNSIHPGQSTVTVQLAGPPFAVPVGASALSMNLTSDQATGPGFITVYPADGAFPLASNLNFVLNTAVANAGLVKLSAGGALNTFANIATHVIIDVNGYFTGTQ